MEVLSPFLHSLEGVDVSILLFVQEYLRIPLLNRFFTAFTHLGDMGLFWIALAVVLLIPARTRKPAAMALFSMGVGAVICNLALKPYFARVRPYDAYESLTCLIGPQWDYSFPSGHTCNAFCSAFVYLKTLDKPYGVVTVILAALLAFSRLYVGVHYPSDILGGLVVALIASVVILVLFGGNAPSPAGKAAGRSRGKGRRRR